MGDLKGLGVRMGVALGSERSRKITRGSSLEENRDASSVGTIAPRDKVSE
jgi:hypothetical protein